MAAITNTYGGYDGRTIDSQATFGTTPAAITTSAAFGSQIDVGAARGRWDVIVDVSTVNVATGDISILIVQGGTVSGFGSGTIKALVALPFGDTASIGNSADDAGDERVKLSFENFREGTTFRYLRIYVASAGSPSMTINQAFLTPRA